MEISLHRLDGVAWQRVVVALLHSLWQGAMLAAAAWALLRGVSARQARLRYGIALAGLLGTLTASMATFHFLNDVSPRASGRPFLQQDSSLTRQEFVPSPSAARGAGGTQDDGCPAAAAFPSRLWEWAVSLWLGGMLVMLTRAGWLLLGAGRLLSGCRMSADAKSVGTLEELRRAMGVVRPVRLAVGPAIRVPAVLGVIAPVILLPAAALSEMPVEHLRMILAHELAHVRRHDYLVNLLQLLVEALLFFNPAVWWLSREVRIEREACCDALAVAVSGSGADYVRSLADVAAGLVGTQPGLRLTPAIRGQGGIVDRAKRVLIPGHRPEIRLPWYSLLAMTAIALSLLGGMWRGTQVVVRAAEKLMTPAERVERVAELQNDLGPPAINDPPVPAELLELSGTIRTEDGNPLPKRTEASVQSLWRNGAAGYDLHLDPQGHFSLKVEGNQARVWVQSPGYAPALSESLRVGPDGKFPAVDLVLGKGFDGRLRLTDPSGTPVPDAPVSIGYLRDDDAMNPFAVAGYTSDAQGAIILRHAADLPAQVTVDLRGYEYDRIATRLQAGHEATVRLTPAKIASGVITDAASHRPLPGASVALLQRKGFETLTWHPRGLPGTGSPVATRADAQGRFALDRLREDSTYAVWVTAADHAPLMLQGVRAGQGGLDWALGSAKPITVEIRAIAADMPRSIDVENPLLLGDTSYSNGFKLPVVVKNGLGIAVLEEALPGHVTFSRGDAKVRVDPDKVNGPVVFDLAAKPKPHAMRPVVVKLHWPADGTEPRGKLRVDYLKPENPNGYWPEELEVKNGEVRVSVPVPTQFGYSQGTLAGYWIDQKHEIAVPVGDEPFVIDVQADPAGAIHGTVLDEKGRPFTQYFYVSVVTVRPSPAVTPGRSASLAQPFNSVGDSGKYLVSPLPLGGSYRIMATAGAHFAVSDEIAVGADQPIRTADLKFAPGTTVAGKVFGPDGEPINGVTLRFQRHPVSAGPTLYAEATTARDGTFAFDHVDAAATGYALIVRPGAGTQGMELKDLPVNDGQMVIRLKAGLPARGRILDAKSGLGMANAKVFLVPRDSSRARYTGQVDAMTNEQGEFEARGLEAIEYSMIVPNTNSSGATLLRDADGKPAGAREPGPVADRPVVRGGQQEVIEIKRLRLLPG